MHPPLSGAKTHEGRSDRAKLGGPSEWLRLESPAGWPGTVPTAMPPAPPVRRRPAAAKLAPIKRTSGLHKAGDRGDRAGEWRMKLELAREPLNASCSTRDSRTGEGGPAPVSREALGDRPGKARKRAPVQCVPERFR
jgi:hypothetical protein